RALVGHPEWSRDDPELDSCVEQWTSGRARDEIVAALREHGLRAAPVTTIAELATDPQLVHREFWRTTTHPLGAVTVMAPPFLLSDTPAVLQRAGPTLGEHNEEIWPGRLGLSDTEYRALAANELLARVAEKRGIAMGVGSQRAALRDPMLVPTYSVVRQSAPTAFVIANVGISQLVKQDREAALGARDLGEIVSMVKADALAVHLNYLEESVQPEGQTRARGALAAIRALTKRSRVPVIAKETGAGITRDVALRLRRAGVKAIDVGGVGGTSFAAIEAMRAGAQSDMARMSLGNRFRDWGVPTAVAVAGVAGVGLPLIATGGVRSGLDAAKAIALGATL